MKPQVIEQRLYFKILNVPCRIMGLWFVFVYSIATLVPILALVIGALGPRSIIPYSLKMIVGFGVGIAIGIVALKMRSFRPDLPQPRPGQATNWWTGDLVEQGGKVAV
jgi:hypothetical protein